MFVENKENGRFDPLIARYYPNNKSSVRNFDEIYYNKIDLEWSGIVDIWTYDERHFIGFEVKNGVLENYFTYDFGDKPNSRKSNTRENFDMVDCVRIPTYVTYSSSGDTYETHVVTITQQYANICTSGGGSNSSTGIIDPVYYIYLNTTYTDDIGGYGGEITYTPPPIPDPLTVVTLDVAEPDTEVA